MTEQTFAMIKPDAIKAGYLDKILNHITSNGFKIVMQREFTFSLDDVEYFYQEHKNTSWFGDLKTFMMSGPCVGLVLEKPNAVVEWRKLIGPTNVSTAKTTAPNSLRALYGDAENSSKNACHGSDGLASASREILFFTKNSE